MNLYAGIALPNPASVALHEAIGMRRIGVYEGVGSKFGRLARRGPGYGLRMAEPGLPLAEPGLPLAEPVPLPELL